MRHSPKNPKTSARGPRSTRWPSKIIDPLHPLGIITIRQKGVLKLVKELRYAEIEPSPDGIDLVYYDSVWGPTSIEICSTLNEAIEKARSYLLRPPAGVR